jgi:predicted AAA+ superfamily ATPase
MFERLAVARLRTAAQRFPVIAIVGARQVGKTTLARAAFPGHAYRDLEDPRTADRFRDDPRFALDESGETGLVLDEAQAIPALFPALRGAVDERRAMNGRFVLLGSAQPGLGSGIAESLAGRVATIELDALTACEAATGDAPAPWRTVWLKGGFPDALKGDFRDWWDAYLRMLLERDLPQYGVRADASFMRRLLTMLAHQHGGLLNASALGGSLGVSHHAIQRHLDVLEQVFLIRRLAPYFRNIGKRLTKAPKVYLRDTGLLHHLLNISSERELADHPARGASWEGFVIEDVLRRERVAHPGSLAHFWRTLAGAEVDLVLDRGAARVAIEVKVGRGDQAIVVRSLRHALTDLGAERAWIVDQGSGVTPLGPQIARGGFEELAQGTP